MNASNATIWLRARVLSPPWLWTILLIAIGLIEPGLNQARAQTANCPTYRICSGQTATLTTAPGLTNIKWYKDGAVIAGATSATYTTSQPGAYAYAGYNTASACRDSLCCPITLVASTPYQLCLGQSMTLTAATNLTNMKWYRDGTLIAGATSATYSTTQTGTYTYAGDNAATGCRDTLCCPLIVNGCSASLGDYVWLDTNQNGQQDAGETGVASVTAVLYNATTNQPLSTTVTDANGKYLFTNLYPGSYYVKFTAPSGTTFTSANVGNDATDSDAGVGGQTGVYSLTAGQQDLTVDAGLIPLKASLGDYVWLDTNQNGQQDTGETGVASVTVTLYNATTNQPLSTTLTDANGKYLFTNLDPGSYYVKFTAPSGMTFTSANVGNDATDSDAGVGGQTGVYSLTAGQQDLTVDAGLIPLKASLGDYVWLDTNQNGQQDAGETGVASVTAVLYNATTNQPISTTLTDANGKYLFTNLDPGSYYVKFTAPSGMTFTSANVGNDATDSDAGVGGQTGVYSLTAGQQDLTVDAGLIPVQVFDLALVKKLATGQSANVTPGSSVTFTITVYNQGNVDATNVQVTDYIPTGLTLNDGSWTASGGKATLNSLIASLPAGQSTTRNIVFTVGSGVTGSVTNTAEISSASNVPGLPDKDSTPDNDPTNDGTPVNDDTTGDHKNNPSQDEDDSDPEVINVNPAPVFDLALVKKLATGQSANVTPGSSVTFTVTVYNQGNVDATNVQVTDYIPTGLTLNDGSWTASGSKATLNSVIASLPAGQSTTRNIVFTVGSGVTGSVTNTAEISSASNVPGLPDKDSTPDNDPTNDGTPVNDDTTGDHKNNPSQDEDDSDPEVINVTPVAKASLGDYVWLDTNQNGQQDAGETGVASVTAVLYNATTNQPISTTLTDANGKYLFTNLDPGSYYVKFTAPSGMTFTSANVGNDATDSDAGVGGQTGVYSLTAGQQDLTVDAGLIPVSTPCVPASYTLCGAKTSFTLTAGSMYTNVQWYKDGVAIPGATSIDYVATTAGLYSYTATDASGCSTSLCCPISITVCAPVCEKPILSLVNPTCSGNGYYSVSLISSTASLMVSAGQLSGASIINIPIGTPVSVTASNGVGCYNVLTADSPTDCANNGGNNCTPPKLSVGQPLCQGTGFYTVSYRLTGVGSVSSNVGQVNTASRVIENIPVGTNVVVTASGSGTCVTRLTVVSPVSCANPCENPAITLSGPECVAGSASYEVSYTVAAGTTLQVSQGMASNGVISGIPSGIPVSVTVTTANGCQPMVVIVPPASCTVCTALGLNTGTTLAQCGQANGIATVVVNAGSGVAPYSYQWTNASGSVVSSSSLATGLAAGTYTVTVTDSKGCTGQKQITISSTSAPVILAQASPTSCGAPNGSASVQVSNGNGSYTYQWSTSAGIVVGSSASVMNLAAGTYTVRVSDGSGCSSTTSVVVGTSSPVNVVASAQNAVCGQATGSISLQVSGGSGSYSYQWRNAAGVVVATSQNLVNVAPGNYNVTVSDANGCVGVASANISNLAGPQVSGVATNVKCFGTQTGSVVLSVTGGTPPIGYVWSNGSTSKDLNNVGAGVYTVTARDANGCMAVQSFTISQPSEIAAVFQPTQPTCTSVNGGSVSLVSISGGTAPYSYTWSNGSTAASINNLSGGTYMLTIKDAAGCVASPVAILLTPTGCNNPVCEKPVLTVGSPVCNPAGGTYSVSLYSSTASVVASSGTVNLSAWMVSGIPVGTPVSITASNGVGCYNVSMVDSPTDCANNGGNNCTPPKLTVGQPLCQGTGFYTVSYRLTGVGSVSSNVGQVNTASRVIENIPVGTNVVVTASGSGTCVTRLTVVSPVSCANPCENPAITLSGPECVAGSASYEVSYTVAAGTSVLVSQGMASNGVISGIPSGIPLSVTVTTANGCQPMVVIVPPASCTVCTALGLNTGTTLAQCGQANGIATVVVNAGSGVAPYSYQWTNASGSVVSSSSIAQGLAPGVYTVTVTDSKGCTGQKQITISSTSAPVIVAQASPTSCGQANGSASVQVSSGVGSYSYRWTNSADVLMGTSASLNGLPADTYTVSVSDGSGCSSTTSVVVGTSSPVNVVASAQNAVCGQATGSISLQVSGGSGSYSYQWRNAAGVVVATSQNLVNVAPGNYNVTVSDAAGCTAVASANISNLAGPQVSGVATNVKCFGTQTGSVVLSVTGGTPPIGYVWSNGSTSKDLVNVGAGVYTVTARDANGCMAVQSFTISQPSEIAAVFQPTQPTCTSVNGGSVSLVSISGGTSPYSYTWSNGSTAASINNLSGGTYMLTIKDAAGCVASPVAILNTPTGCSTPVFDLALRKTLAAGQSANVTAGSSVTFTVTVYNQGNVDATNVQVTDYIPAGLTLNDAGWSASNGQATLNSVIASLPAGQSVSRNITFTVGSGVTGSITNTAEISSAGNGQNLPDKDSDPDNNPTNDGTPINDDISGDHKHNPSQDEDDSDIEGINVTPTCLALGLNTGTTLAQCGQANGIATVVVNAGSGVAPYSYQWTNASGSVVSSSSLATGLAAGTYTVTVTDSKGCTGQKQITISSTSAPVIVAQASPTSCGQANGSASVQVSSGVGSYSYRWTNSADVLMGTSASLNGLPAGTYMVSVSDGSGCSSTTSVVVGTSSPVNVVASAQNAVCGQATGSISLQVSGGSGSYSYQWRNAAGVVVATSQNLVNVAPGSYNVTVSDANGCVGVASANISNLAGPQLSGVTTNVKCFGTQTGSVVLSVTGGTPPIGYVWSNGSTSKDLVNVGAGVYTVTARDANGCMAVQSFTISQPSEIAAVFQPTQPTCTSVNGGSVSLVSISGGTSPYSYTWSNGSTAASINNLSGGTYMLTIKDAAGCVASPVAILNTPTGCSTPVFDLALRKTLAAGQSANVTAGSSVTFTVTVYNQGNVDATNVQVTDYIPAGLTLNDAGWSASNGQATLNSVIASLPAGQSVSRNITFTVGSGVTGSITNTAEISSAGNGQNLPDKDSDPDNNPTNDGTPINDDISGDHKHNPSQDEDDSDGEGINVTPACEKPVLTAGSPVCNPANGTYSVSLYSSTANVRASSGSLNLSTGLISGIQVGTPVSITASNGEGCFQLITVDSPASCPTSPACTQPNLTVGQPICQGNGYYTVNFTVEQASVQANAGRISGNSVVDIPLGTNLVLSATDGACVTRLTVMAPASCTSACENPAISLSGPICDDKGTTTYYLNYTVTSGATVRVSQGYANGHWIYGVPSGVPLSLTVSTPGCGDKVVTIPGRVCGQTPQPLLDLTKQVNKTRAGLGDVVTYTLTLTNKGTGTATNVEVQESMSAGLALVPGSITTSLGSYAATSPVGIWTVPSLAAGATATMTFSASLTQVGVVYNTAAIPGDTATVCTTVPVKVCQGAPIQVAMSAPAGYGSYQWYRNGVAITGATSRTYTAGQYGEFTVQVNGGQCPNGACCPIVVEEEAGVTFTLATQAPTCNSGQPMTNGTLTISGLAGTASAYRYAISAGTSFTLTSPALQAVPMSGVLASNLTGGQSYTVRIYNGAGCYKDQTVTVGVANCGCQVEPPVVTCAITEICKGGSTVLSTRGCEAGTIRWSNGQSGATIVATPSVTTTYTASCVVGSCVSPASNAITITVLDVPTPTLSASVDHVCPGTSVTLTATGCEAGTVIWSEQTQTGRSIVVTPYGKTTYTAQCRMNSCLSAPALITINVDTDLPTPTVTCSTTIVCPGETVTLTAENCVGTPIWNSTTETTTSIVVTPTASSNRYWVYCKNGACTSKSSNVYTIAVVTPVVPTLSASADTVCLGGSVVLTANGCNGSVLWSTGQTGTSITVTPTANISYYAQCKFRACLSDQSSAVAIAVVNPQAPIVKVSQTMLCSGSPVSLTASGCNGTVIWHGVSRVGSVITIYPTESKEYYATCKQGTCESSASNTVRITVTTSSATAPVVTASTTQVCDSGVVSLTATGCNGNVTWSDGQTGAVVTVRPTATNREFYALCVPTSGVACGSAKSNVITISVAQPVTPTIVASRTSVCAGESVTLTASGCNGTVKWSNGQSGATIQVSPQMTTDYQATCSVGACESALSSKVTVVVNPAATAPVITASSLTVCSGSVVSLSATGCSGTVKWSDGQMGSVVSVTPTAASHDFSAICQTAAQCSSGSSNVISINLAPTAAPTITASRDAICSGEKVTLTATGCNGTVTWYGINRMGSSIDIYPTATTTYYATCRVGTCESAASNTVNVVVNTGLGTVPVVTASTQQVCGSGVVSLTATGCSSGTVIWSDGQTGAIVSMTATQANHEFYALCKDASQCGTGKSNVITVTVTTMQTPVAVCSTDSICAGEEVTLTAQNCQGTPHWSTGETTSSIIVRPTVTTGYTVYCTLNGCTSPTSKSYVITVVPVAEPTITASTTVVEAGGTVTLTASGCPGTVIWSAADIHGNNTGTSIVVRPEGTQTYSAQCKYRTCLSDPSITIVVNPGNCVVKAGGLTPVNATVCGASNATVAVAATLSGGLVQPSGYSVVYLLAKDGLVQQLAATPQFSVPSAAAHYSIHTLVYNATSGDAAYLNLADIKPGLSRTTDVQQLISGKCAAFDATGAKLTVSTVNAPTLSTNALTVCNGGMVSLTATGCSGNVKWSDGKEGAVYQTTVYSERTLTAICEVDGCASSPSAPVRISLGSPAVPVIVSTPSICLGETVSLTATGCAEGGYLWSDGSTTGAILTVTPNADVTYRVKCKLSTCEGEWSASATVHVGKPSAPTLSVQGSGSTTVCYGSPVTLVATGCPATAAVIWSNNMTGSSITVSPASTETYTAYCGAGTCRSDASAGITLTVLPKVTVPTVVDKTNTCPITTVDLSTGVTSQVTTTGGMFEYYTDAALTTKVANPAAVGAGTYYVIERTVTGCTSLPAVIHVQITTCTEPSPCDGVNPATADAGADANVCSTTSYQLRGVQGGGGKTAHWTTSGSGRFDNPYSLSAIYTASAEDVQTGAVTLTLAVSTSNVNCPVATDQMVLTFNGVKTQPTITVVGATQLCAGDSVILKSSEASSYRWNTGAVSRSIVVKQSGVYSVQVLDDKGCISVKSAEVTVKVADPVLPPLVHNLRNTCPSKIVDLTQALSATTVGSSYIYRICECNTSNIVIRPDSVCEGTYWIVEKTAQGCVSHPAKVVVRVFNCATDTLRSDVRIAKTVNRTMANGSPVTYTLTVSNAGPHTAYNVDVRDVLPAGLQLLPSAGYNFVNGVITKRIDSLKAGASAQIVFSARIVKKGEDIVNKAEITYLDNVDPNLTNNSSSVTVRDTASAPMSQTGTAGLGLALSVVNVASQPDGSYNVTYKGTIRNTGSIDLQGLSLVDSLSQSFMAPASYSVVRGPMVGAGSTLVANADFNGHTQTDLLTGASTLAAGVQDTVVFVVNVKPNGNSGPFYSSATVTGTTPDATQTAHDISNNGVDPVADGTVATTVRFDLPQGLLGISNSAGTPTMVQKGIYDIPYTITLTNMGRVALKQVQVIDNLSQTFGSGALVARNRIRVSSTGTLTVDTLYTGQGLITKMLVDSASTLAVGAKATLSFTVRVDVRNAPVQSASLTFYNTAYGTALTADNQMVADTSTAGTNADPDNDLDPRNNSQSTPVSLNGLATDAHIGLAMAVADTVRQADGSYNVTYQIVVKAYGPDPLKNVLITDTLSKVFNSQTGSIFTLVKAPFITSTGSALKLNPNYNGVSDPVIVLGDSTSSLAVGKVDTIRLVINVISDGSTTTFLNSAYGLAQYTGGTVSDVSTSGLNPDLNGNGDPTDTNEREATTLTLLPTYQAIFIPQGFSPNGDGINDRFVIRGLNGLTVSLQVYNRWGNLVYQNEDYQNDWDGKPNTGIVLSSADSNGVPDGTYYYVVNLSDGRKFVRYMTINR